MNVTNETLGRSNGGHHAQPVERAVARTAMQVLLFDRTWRATVLGRPALVELRIYQNDQQFQFQILVDVVGQKQSFNFDVNGNFDERIPLIYGFGLDIGVSNWRISPAQLAFDLAIGIIPPFGLPTIPVVRMPVMIPMGHGANMMNMASMSSMSSPADLLALIELSNLTQSAQGDALVAARPRDFQPRVNGLNPMAAMPDTRELAWGTFSYGNSLWGGSENPLVCPYVFPIGSQRVGDADVYLSPGNGGWCNFLRWYNPTDPTDCRFYFHVGWRGTQGGTVNWVVNGYPSS
jgi:hypothetical protein